MSKRIWLFAFLMAISVHALGFVLFFSDKKDDGAKQQGEQGVEIDLGMLGDMGQQEQSQLETTVAETLPEPEPEIIPEPVPPKKQTPVEPKAEVEAKQVTKVKVKAKPKKPKVKPKPVTKPVIEEAPAPAPVTSTAKKATTVQQASRKQSTGKADALTTGGSAAAKQSYFNLLVAELIKHKHYPSSSRRRGEEGIVKLYFIVDKQGKIIDYRINEGSGSKRLDKAALTMLKKASLPPFPRDMTQDTLEINVPISFHLNNS